MDIYKNVILKDSDINGLNLTISEYRYLMEYPEDTKYMNKDELIQFLYEELIKIRDAIDNGIKQED